jgi:hypothetical protein
MKLKEIILSLFVISITILSCSKDNSTPAQPVTTTVAEDKQNITSSIEGFYTCLNTLDDGDLSNFMLYSLFNSTDQQYNGTWIKKLSNKFESQFGKIVLNDKLQFAQRTGIYNWDNTTLSWIKTNDSSIIKLIFPSKENQTLVDSELSFNSYSDINVTYNAKTSWVPTAANLTLKRSGVTLFSINLSNVTFDINTNFSMPTNADISIFTSPFTHTFQWRRISSTEFQFGYNSSTPQGCGTSSVTNIKLQDADYGNITSLKQDVKMITGTLIEGNLKVVYSANVEAIAAFPDPTPAQINNNSDAEVFYNNLKIGDLNYQKINNKTEIFIIYSDGTTENVNLYVENFQNRIETIFANYLN